MSPSPWGNLILAQPEWRCFRWCSGALLSFETDSKLVQTGPKLVQNWFKTGSKLVQNWFKTGSKLIQNWFKTGSKLVQTGSKLVHGGLPKQPK